MFYILYLLWPPSIFTLLFGSSKNQASSSTSAFPNLLLLNFLPSCVTSFLTSSSSEFNSYFHIQNFLWYSFIFHSLFCYLLIHLQILTSLISCSFSPGLLYLTFTISEDQNNLVHPKEKRRKKIQSQSSNNETHITGVTKL